MKLSREHIILTTVLVAILAALGAVYQFYYKERLKEYAKNLADLKAYEGVLSNLETTFSTEDGGGPYKPDALVEAYRNQVMPLAERVMRQGQFFNVEDWFEINPAPEGVMMRFYYKDEFNKMMGAFRQDAMSRVPYCPYPETTFGVRRPEELEGVSVNAQMVESYLRRLKFGCSTMKMMFDAKAKSITDVALWGPRPGANGMITYWTTGLHFSMNYKDLVEFMDELRLSPRFFSVDALSIQNQYLRWPIEPPVQVRMLLTQAVFNPPRVKPAGQAEGPPGQPPTPGAPVLTTGVSPTEVLSAQGFPTNRRQMDGRRQPLTRTQRYWRTFKKYFWPF